MEISGPVAFPIMAEKPAIRPITITLIPYGSRKAERFMCWMIVMVAPTKITIESRMKNIRSLEMSPIHAPKQIPIRAHGSTLTSAFQFI